MAKSLIFCLALAADQIATSNAAIHPHGGAEGALQTSSKPIGGPGNAAVPSGHTTQAFHYIPAIHVPPPHYTSLSPTLAANASAPVANASLPVGPVSSASGTSAAGPDVVITEIVTSYTTYCPRATAITVHDITYSANASAVLTITNCPGGCRVTRAVSEISKSTVTAVVSRYTTSLAGPTTLSLQGSMHTVTKATVLTISSCPGGCTVTTDLRALVSSAKPAQCSPKIWHGHGVAANATISSPVTASLGTGSPAGSTGFAAGHTFHQSNSTAPLQQAQIGAAAGKEFSFATFLLACLVIMF